MEEPQLEANQKSSSSCVICLEPIRLGARKCIHCGGHQGVISRHLGFSGTILSLIVALVSVSAFVVPIVHSTLNPDANIKAAVIGSDGSYMQIVISNVGTRPGSFRNISITRSKESEQRTKKGLTRWGLDRVQLVENSQYETIFGYKTKPPKFEGQVIEPGQQVTMIFVSPYYMPTLADDSEHCILHLETTTFNGVPLRKDIQFKCECEDNVGQKNPAYERHNQ